MNKQQIIEVLSRYRKAIIDAYENEGGFPIAGFYADEIMKQQSEVSDEPTEERWPRTTPTDLFYHVCYIMNAEADKARSKSRHGRLIKVRIFFYLLGSSIYDFGPSMLGRVTNRDHSTVLHHINKWSGLIDSTKPWYDEELDMKVRKVKAKLHERLTTIDN